MSSQNQLEEQSPGPFVEKGSKLQDLVAEKLSNPQHSHEKCKEKLHFYTLKNYVTN